MQERSWKQFLKKPGWLHRPTRSDLLLMIASPFISAVICPECTTGRSMDSLRSGMSKSSKSRLQNPSISFPAASSPVGHTAHIR